MLKKIYNYFYPDPLDREDIIKNTLRVPFDSLILKYDYCITDKLRIFKYYDGMLAMTVLPNGDKLIAYVDDTLKIWNSDQSFPCRFF